MDRSPSGSFLTCALKYLHSSVTKIALALSEFFVFSLSLVLNNSIMMCLGVVSPYFLDLGCFELLELVGL